MDQFSYQSGQLHAEDVSLCEIAERFGTPCYVYSRAAIEHNWQSYHQAFGSHPHLICYAVKANSNLAVLNLLSRLGSGFDIVSVGELERVLLAGGNPASIVFAGVGKKKEEMRRALEAGIRCFNVESVAELERLNAIAGEMGVQAPVSFRVNPDVDAETHPYISTGLKRNKFGIAISEAPAVYEEANAMSHIDIVGVGCHIGSQLTGMGPFLDALQRLLMLVETLESTGIPVRQIDVGGGLGIRYEDETPPSPGQYVNEILSALQGRDCELLLEPGRSIVGNAGVLLTRVEYLKSTEEKNFAIVDAAMNDLLRPALYDAWQGIVEVVQEDSQKSAVYDVVGPVCETGDFLGKDRELAIRTGDLLAVRSAGAYGFTMSSSYNTRPRAAEVLVDGSESHLVRTRDSIADLVKGESIIP